MLRTQAKDCRACDLWERATRQFSGKGTSPRASSWSVNSRATMISAGIRSSAPQGAFSMKRSRGRGSIAARLRDQRGQTFQMGAARKVSHSEQAQAGEIKGVPSLGSEPSSKRSNPPPSCAWAPRRRKPCSEGHFASASTRGKFIESPMASARHGDGSPVVDLRAPDDATRHQDGPLRR